MNILKLNQDNITPELDTISAEKSILLKRLSILYGEEARLLFIRDALLSTSNFNEDKKDA